MIYDQVLQTIKQLEDKYISIWKDVCNIESPTNDKAGVDAVGTYFIRLANDLGWHVEIFEQPIAGNVVEIMFNDDVNASPLSLSGHMDTVHAVGSFGTPAVRIENGVIYGPGVTDCKGGIVAGFLAMEALWRCSYRARPVVMYLQSDEEGGGKFSNDETIRHICEKAKDSVAFLNLEGGEPGALCNRRKGIASFEVTVTGAEAHSAICATAGANAILEAAHKIIELEKFKDPDGLTCCCSVIKGGTKHNVVPGCCEFTANVRFATQAQLEEFRKYIENLMLDVKVAGCKCSVHLPRIRPALEECARNDALIDRMNEIWTSCGLSPLQKRSSLGGSDAANVSTFGIPAVDNLGTFGGRIHTVNEYGLISSLSEQAERIALVALYI